MGTGIGVGILKNGRSLSGMAHFEMGHIYPPHDYESDPFPGRCPFHNDCLEGLASGPAISARWGATLSDLPPTHPAHHRVAGYLAQACHTLFASTSVETVVLGGGTTNHGGRELACAPGRRNCIGNDPESCRISKTWTNNAIQIVGLLPRPSADGRPPESEQR